MHITRPEPSRPHAPAGSGVESLRASGGPPSNLPYTSRATYPIPPCRSTLHRPRPSTLHLPSDLPYTSPGRIHYTTHLPRTRPPGRPTLYIPPTFLTPALPSHLPCTPPRKTAPHVCVPRATYPIPHHGKLCACLCPPTGLPYTRHPAANSGRRPTTTIVSSL
jgi:hypothetical protein